MKARYVILKKCALELPVLFSELLGTRRWREGIIAMSTRMVERLEQQGKLNCADGLVHAKFAKPAKARAVYLRQPHVLPAMK